MTEEQGQSRPHDSFEYDSKENVGVSVDAAQSQPIPATPIPAPEAQPMNGSQKTLLWGVGVIGLLVLGLAVWQMRSIIQVPWPNLASADTRKLDLQTVDAVEDVNAMKNKDTDSDGLSDYDELQRYGTSPYLADTDSDGKNDKDEILLGTDPNCPEGKTCFAPTAPDAASVAAGDAGTAGTSGTTDTAGTAATVQPTPDQLRELLRQSGQFTEEQIVAFTDEELMNLYNKVLAENPDLQATASTQTTTPTVQSYTPAQIRQLLKEQGITDEELAQIDDATLVEMYKKALAEVTAPTTP